MKWLGDIKQQLEAQACLSSMTKLTPDDAYGGMYYAVHPDYFDRLIEIAGTAEWGRMEWAGDEDNEFEVPSCPICSAAEKNINGGKHFPTCPYSDEWVKS